MRVPGAVGSVIGVGLLVIVFLPVAPDGLFEVGPFLALGLFARIDGAQVLANPVRARLCGMIAATPGMDIAALRKGLGLGWGTTVYHLNRMEAAGVIRSIRSGRHRLFVPPHAPPAVGHALSGLSNRTVLRLAAAVVSSPGGAQRDLAAAAGIPRSLACRYLRQLERRQLVVARRDGRYRRFWPTTGLADARRIHEEITAGVTGRARPADCSDLGQTVQQIPNASH